MLGEPVELIIGIVNHEYEVLSYRIDIVINGIENKEIATKTLAHEEEWKQVVNFTPDSLGEGFKVEIWLYKYDDAEPYFQDPLHLYINVTN